MTEKINIKIASDKAEAQKIADKLVKKISHRDIAEFQTKSIDSQSDYEKRYYMRNFHKDEKLDIVRHKTNKTTNDIIDAFVQYVVSTKQTRFETKDLINAFETCGSSYGDIIRRAMRTLASKQFKAVKIINIADKKHTIKAHYCYIVNTKSELFKDFFAVNDTVEQTQKINEIHEASKI